MIRFSRRSRRLLEGERTLTTPPHWKGLRPMEPSDFPKEKGIGVPLLLAFGLLVLMGLKLYFKF